MRISIDLTRPMQRIDGFGSGAFGGFTLFDRGYADAEFAKGVTYITTAEQRDAMVTMAVRELGVTHLRMWLCPAGIEQTNDNDDPQVMAWDKFTWEGNTGKPLSDKPHLNRRYGLREWKDFLVPAVRLGARNWIVTPGWMPEWLKKRFDDPADPDRFEEYAEWAAAHLLFLKKEFGLEAPYWSMFNEPDVQGWKAVELWIPWVKATVARFRKEGLATKIMLPDFMNVYEAVPLTKALLDNDEIRPHVGAIAYHHYRSSFDDPQGFLQITSQPATADAGKLHHRLTAGARAMAELGRQYGIPSWQTETAYYPKPLKDKHLSPWDVALGRANEIYYELDSGASAVAGMLTIWIDAIDPRYDYTVRMTGHHIVMRTDGRKVTEWAVTKDGGAIFAHYGRFVRPGDQRVTATCEDRMLRATAFLARGGTQVVAVVINNSRTARPVTFQLGKLGFAPASMGGVMTDEQHTLVRHPLVPVYGDPYAEYRAELPPSCICTFVWSADPDLRFELPAGTRFW